MNELKVKIIDKSEDYSPEGYVYTEIRFIDFERKKVTVYDPISAKRRILDFSDVEVELSS